MVRINSHVFLPIAEPHNSNPSWETCHLMSHRGRWPCLHITFNSDSHYLASCVTWLFLSWAEGMIHCRWRGSDRAEEWLHLRNLLIQWVCWDHYTTMGDSRTTPPLDSPLVKLWGDTPPKHSTHSMMNSNHSMSNAQKTTSLKSPLGDTQAGTLPESFPVSFLTRGGQSLDPRGSVIPKSLSFLWDGMLIGLISWSSCVRNLECWFKTSCLNWRKQPDRGRLAVPQCISSLDWSQHCKGDWGLNFLIPLDIQRLFLLFDRFMHVDKGI